MKLSITIGGCFVCLFCCTLLAIPVFAQTVFFDDFNTYSTNIELAGQGGWYKEAFRAPLMLSATTPLGGSVAVDGLRPTGTGTFNDSNMAFVFHSLAGLNSTGVSIVSMDAYGFSAYNSHNAGMLISSSDTSVLIQALASWYPSNSPAWEFAGRNGDDFIYGGYDELVRLEIVLDGAAGEWFGRLTYSGGVAETPHHAITPAQIAQISLIGLYEDFRNPYLGADFDNVTVVTTYGVCLLYDPAKPANSGAAVPIKLQLCNSSGDNLSASNVKLHAVSITGIGSTGQFAVLPAGNANQDDDFRFNSSGYIFNLKTAGLPPGSYNLNFTVGGDSFVYSAPFEIK